MQTSAVVASMLCASTIVSRYGLAVVHDAGAPQRFYQRRLCELGHAAGRTGSVTAIQRGSSDLRLNPHLHGVFVDGVFVEQPDGELRLVALPELSDLVVCELLQTIAARVQDHLRRQGLLSDDDDAALGCAAQPHADAEQLVLSALAAASSLGQALAGPETRPGRMPHLHQADAQPRIERPLCTAWAGFSAPCARLERVAAAQARR